MFAIKAMLFVVLVLISVAYSTFLSTTVIQGEVPLQTEKEDEENLRVNDGSVINIIQIVNQMKVAD